MSASDILDEAEVIKAATDVLEFAVDRTTDFEVAEAACTFALAVATAGAALGSLTKQEFLDMMTDVWDHLDKTDDANLN